MEPHGPVIRQMNTAAEIDGKLSSEGGQVHRGHSAASSERGDLYR